MCGVFGNSASDFDNAKNINYHFEKEGPAAITFTSVFIKMKMIYRKIKNWLFLIMISLFFGCKSANFKSQEKMLEFKGNPTTGYTWNYEIGDINLIQIEENVQYLGENEVVGAPSLFIYKIKSLKAGCTTLKFEYKRTWENNPPSVSHYYDVKVKDDGSILIEEKKVE